MYIYMALWTWTLQVTTEPWVYLNSITLRNKPLSMRVSAGS